MDSVRKEILTAAIAHYGRGPQRDKAIEELSELIRALARCDNREAVRIWYLRKLRRLGQTVGVGDEVR